MFTGLIERLGRIGDVRQHTTVREFTIRTSGWDQPLVLGESIAIDGICLTVAGMVDDGFVVQVITPTLERTTAAEWINGRVVNLERALRAQDRLGGHLVQGHIDATGTVLRIEQAGEDLEIELQLPDVVAEVTVLHGSIALDGVSLTVSDLPRDDVARVALIPHTRQHTNLSRLEPGTRVNLEGDLIGRFVVGYLKRWALPALG
jgi:riboflavin synthase